MRTTVTIASQQEPRKLLRLRIKDNLLYFMVIQMWRYCYSLIYTLMDTAILNKGSAARMVDLPILDIWI
jgi:hypothetical protein